MTIAHEAITRELLVVLHGRVAAAYGFCPRDDRGMLAMLSVCSQMLLNYMRLERSDTSFDLEETRAYIELSELALREFTNRQHDRPPPIVHMLRDGAETWCQVVVGMFDQRTWTRVFEESTCEPCSGKYLEYQRIIRTRTWTKDL